MFRAFYRPSSGAQWLQRQPLILPSYRGNSRAVFVVGPARTQTQHDCHHDTKVKSEAATAVTELLIMGGKTPETCWAVNKRQDNKLKNCCIWLVIYLNCTMMHGLTNLKHYVVWNNIDSSILQPVYWTYPNEWQSNLWKQASKIFFKSLSPILL